MKLCGVVVLFHPDDEVLKNINTYLSDLEVLYAIDNSQDKSNLFSNNKKIKYIANCENKGIAKALNQACLLAIKEGYSYILTMDQDSAFQNKDLNKMKKKIEQSLQEDIGIYSPLHQTASSKMNCNIHEETEVVMTSGNIIDLRVWEKIGGFDEDFFIDGVDHEYCLHLQKEGYKIKIFQEIPLLHSLGKTEEKKIFGHTITLTNHAPIRRYFITRNRHYIYSKYHDTFKEFCEKELKNQRKETIKMLLFEKQKWEKTKAIIRGKRDYKKNIKGLPEDLKEKLQ